MRLSAVPCIPVVHIKRANIMCMNKVVFRMCKPEGEEQPIGVGYKVVTVDNETGGIFTGIRFRRINKSRWMKSDMKIERMDNYPLGFHLFTNLADAMIYKGQECHEVAEFYFKDVVAFGFERSKLPCVVADSMKFIRIVT